MLRALKLDAQVAWLRRYHSALRGAGGAAAGELLAMQLPTALVQAGRGMAAVGGKGVSCGELQACRWGV